MLACKEYCTIKKLDDQVVNWKKLRKQRNAERSVHVIQECCIGLSQFTVLSVHLNTRIDRVCRLTTNGVARATTQWTLRG